MDAAKTKKFRNTELVSSNCTWGGQGHYTNCNSRYYSRAISVQKLNLDAVYKTK